ncbi:TPM domain-containing protein [Tabrizicola sp. YIM 78059]|uniref:TPM domain-containing protein n=1 Tax=Tabrizicola sp. YIM 78059 TaxID=2529861 RepID=UPI0010AA7741|nr:TPM domain-containing protein [Tabrizicola sp. YIM 78059]
MFQRAIGLILGLSFLSLGPFALAEPLPQPLSDTVSDYAGVLDDAEEGRIVRLLRQLRDETGVQMVVATMGDIADHGGAGMRLDAYAKALFNAWGVGEADRNDGILLLVVTGSREARIALGTGYDAVYDGRAARVLSTAVLPEFREGRIAGGIEGGILSVRDRLIAPFLEGQPVTLTDGFGETAADRDLSWLLGVGGVGGIAAFGLWRMRNRRRCPKCGNATLQRINEVIEPAGKASYGTGIVHLTCSSCGFNERQTYTIRPGRRASSSRSLTGGSSASGSSRGGFGGGRSSGGGASGRW